jgi:hypothetical protein
LTHSLALHVRYLEALAEQRATRTSASACFVINVQSNQLVRYPTVALLLPAASPHFVAKNHRDAERSIVIVKKFLACRLLASHSRIVARTLDAAVQLRLSLAPSRLFSLASLCFSLWRRGRW